MNLRGNPPYLRIYKTKEGLFRLFVDDNPQSFEITDPSVNWISPIFTEQTLSEAYFGYWV